MSVTDRRPRDRRFFLNRFLGSDATLLGVMQIAFAFMSVDTLAARDSSAILMFAALIGAATLALAYVLGRIARGKGYSPQWRWFCLLGLIGVLVVRLLPDRARHGPRRGFPLDAPRKRGG